MGLETGTYIDDLVSTNPVGATDQKAQGDDHLRLIKATLLATFPNITAAMTANHTELNYLDGVTSPTGSGALVLGTGPTIDALTVTTSITLPSASIADAALSSNVPLKDANTTWAGSHLINVANSHIRLKSTTAADPDDVIYFDKNGDTIRLMHYDDSATTYRSVIDWVFTTDILRLGAGVTLAEVEVNATTIDLNGAIKMGGDAEFDGGSLIKRNVTTDSLGLTGGTSLYSGGASFQLFGSTHGSLPGYAYLDADVINFRTMAGSVAIASFSSSAITLYKATNISGGLNAEPAARSITDTGNTATTDAGSVIRMTSGASKTLTLDGDPPTNAVVVLDNSSGNAWTIAASGTLIWASGGATGNRTLADDGLAVALHRGSGVWIINGGGVS